MALTEHAVYKITSPNGKVYIGCSKNVKSRWKSGLYNNLLREDVERYGWNAFKKEVIAVLPTKAEAEKREAEEIARYDSTNHEKGYNIAVFGVRGGVTGYFKGLHLSECHKKRIAVAKHKAVRCVETGCVYSSAKEAEQKTGVAHSSISRACLGKRKTANKQHWVFVGVSE